MSKRNKPFIVTIEEQYGERELWDQVLVTARDLDSAAKEADKVARFWLDDEGGERCDDGWEFWCGESIVKVAEVREIPEEDFEVLQRYMSVM